MKRTVIIRLIPLLISLLGCAVVVWSSLERKRVEHNLDKVFEFHVESVANLIWLSAQQAAAAVDMIYAFSESNLEMAVAKVRQFLREQGNPEKQMLHAGLSVGLVQKEDGTWTGAWGPVTVKERAKFLEQLLATEKSDIFESGLALEFGIYCAWFAEFEKKTVVCKRIDELASFRRNLGLGTFLSGVAKGGIRYAAIQDPQGILASSKEAQLSSFQNDPLLENHLSPTSGLVFRLLEDPQGSLFERVGPFPLPDGSNAVLRVGVDASLLMDIKHDVAWRHQIVAWAAAFLILISIFGAWLLGRWDNKRQTAERGLLVAQEEMRHWQTIGQLAASVAHEIRNPLNTMKMVGQRLKKEFCVAKEEQEDFLELTGILTQQADRIEGVVHDFLQLGRPIELKRERYRAKEILMDLLSSWNIRAQQENKILEADFDEDADIYVDRARLAQILTNLINNALDAVSERGWVRLSASVPEQGGFHLAIMDNGSGMDEEMQKKVLQPFITTKAKGTGLGIPLAIRLIKAHQGTFSMVSEPGEGTKISVWLPPDTKN